MLLKRNEGQYSKYFNCNRQHLPQDERYLHLSVEEMSSVEKCVSETMVWMNGRMNAQSKLGITQDPVVKVADVISKIQVTKTSSTTDRSRIVDESYDS